MIVRYTRWPVVGEQATLKEGHYLQFMKAWAQRVWLNNCGGLQYAEGRDIQSWVAQAVTTRGWVAKILSLWGPKASQNYTPLNRGGQGMISQYGCSSAWATVHMHGSRRGRPLGGKGLINGCTTLPTCTSTVVKLCFDPWHTIKVYCVS